jgi:hypothetical protein
MFVVILCRVVHVFNSEGLLMDQIVTSSPSPVTALQWDSAGEVMTINVGN